MSYPVIISYNSANSKERIFVTKLVNYLSTKSIEAMADDPNLSEPTMKKQLLTAQWLVLILTPEAVRSPRVQSLVNTAFDHIKQGHLQGILALAFSSNPVELEDVPYPWWSTIRTYYAGESDEDQQRAFEKVARTLGYNRVPIHATSSSADNRTSLPAYQDLVSSRPLLLPSRSTQKPRSGLMVPALVFALLIILLGFGATATTFIFKGHSATPTPGLEGRLSAAANKTSTATPKASATATPPLSALNPQQLYTRVTSGQPTLSDPLSVPEQNQWDQNPTCAFTNGMYQITNTTKTQFPLCMDRNTNFANFAYQVQMTFLTIFSGNISGGGLIFRSDQSVTTFYRFSLDSTGVYKLIVCQPCSNTGNNGGKRLTPNQEDVVQNIGYSNTLTVIANNKTFYLYINRTPVSHLVSDSTASAGEIGLCGFSSSQVAFSNLKVWNLP